MLLANASVQYAPILMKQGNNPLETFSFKAVCGRGVILKLGLWGVGPQSHLMMEVIPEHNKDEKDIALEHRLINIGSALYMSDFTCVKSDKGNHEKVLFHLYCVIPRNGRGKYITVWKNNEDQAECFVFKVQFDKKDFPLFQKMISDMFGCICPDLNEDTTNTDSDLSEDEDWNRAATQKDEIIEVQKKMAEMQKEDQRKLKERKASVEATSRDFAKGKYMLDCDSDSGFPASPKKTSPSPWPDDFTPSPPLKPKRRRGRFAK
jgi:hypothetical protein